MKEKVEDVIEDIRPSLQADGGDIELVDFNEENKVVQVRLKGACAGCPASQVTLKQGVERIMKERLPDIERVEAV